MSKKLVIFICIVLIIIITFFAIKRINNKVDISNSELVSFTFNRGYGLGGAINYKIYRENGNVYYEVESFTGKTYDDSETRKEIDSVFLNDLEKIIIENDIASWNGFDEADSSIEDGSGFKLEIKYVDGKEINAKGYMKYPANYKDIEKKIDDFLTTVAK